MTRMPAITSRSRAEDRRQILSRYLFPLILLTALCFSSILALLIVMTSAQDEQEAARESTTLASALDTSVAMVRHDLQDYAKWDDAVRHIAQDFSTAWIDDNVTAYLGRIQNYDEIFVISPDGRTVYSFSDGRRSRKQAVATLGQAFGDSLGEVRRMNAGDQPILSGFSRVGNDFYVYAVAAVVPLTGKVRINGGRYAIAIAERVNAKYLGSIAQKHGLPLLGLSDHVRDPDMGAVPLASRSGKVLGLVTLRFTRPGTALQWRMLPPLAAIFFGVAVAAGLILRQVRQGLEALRESQIHALYHANHDMLTGLPNRRMLIEQLRSALEQREGRVLLYMDLDGFKEVNDLYGHAAGDVVLRQVAARIMDAAGPSSLVARTGGDEFAIVQSPDRADGAGPQLAERIIEAFSRNLLVAGSNIRIGVSIGIVATSGWVPLTDGMPPDQEVDELMRRADVAMYDAKAKGKNRWCAYVAELDHDHRLRKTLERDLRAAIVSGDIDVAYHPVVTAQSRSIVSVEALARWEHPQEGTIGPDIFIPLAEMTGLIGHLGTHVLRTACRAVAPLELKLAVNLAPAQFWDVHLIDQIEAVLAETGFPPERLELEITEPYLLSRPEAAAAIIEKLRSRGIGVALDDFGSGSASIGSLQQFKFNRMKIDKQFLVRISNDPGRVDILAALVALGRSLRLEITAEGVETEAEAALLGASGCNHLQGWLFGRPGPLSSFGLQLGLLRQGTSADDRDGTDPATLVA
ncbi:Periplasmic sensor diguanylate cyclase/phosphodiesterase [Sphingomonas paucimobilis]|nr:Periplasmic sensor diguanylate cyclase/phosphodiesterase [Sphingomonas paucimobilis]